jgi:hypothetical protein
MPTLRYAGAMSALPQDADVSPKPVEIDIPGQGTIVGLTKAGSYPVRSRRRSASSLTRTLLHGGQALMAWVVSNA